MDVKVFANSALDSLRNGFTTIFFTLFIAVVIVVGLWQAEASSRAEGQRLLEEGIQNAVIRHYAVEGNYPESLAVIEERYGIHIDRTRYAVFYEIFAPNIMPDTTVVVKR